MVPSLPSVVSKTWYCSRTYRRDHSGEQVAEGLGYSICPSQLPGTWGSTSLSQCLERLAQGDGSLTNKRGCHQVVITTWPHLKSSASTHPSLWSLAHSLYGTLVDSGILDSSSVTQFSNLMVKRHIITIWIVAFSTGSLMSQTVLNIGVWLWEPLVALTGKNSHIVLSRYHRA